MIDRNLTSLFSTLSMGLLTLILTGCGGAASDSTTTSNKPNPISAAASSTSQIEAESSSTTSVPVTPSSSAVASSKAKSSLASSTYVRASRASASSIASEEEYYPYEIITPEEPIDTKDNPPTQPADARVLSLSTTEISISWTASSDDIGIASYEIYRNGIYVGGSTALKLTYQDKDLTANTVYVYTVRAVDTTGHRSAFSSPLTTRTLAGSSSSSKIASSTVSASSLSSKSASSPSSASGSSQSKASSLSSKSASSKSSISGAFVVDWPTPIRRENGAYLELHEIGGYELRHKSPGSDIYTSLIITNITNSYTFDSTVTVPDSVEIAAFDVNGRYSRFISLPPK